MTSDQAMTGLGAIVGGGGASAIIVALFAYLTEARKGRKTVDQVVAIGDGYAKSKWDEISAAHLQTIAYALTKLVAINEIKAEEEINDKSFHDRLENKIGKLMLEAIKASMMPGK